MLFHMSIAADDPKHVASVVAELWGGKIMAFPPVSDNGWMVLAGDERGTALEVYPHGTVLRESEGDVDAHGEASGTDRYSATHGAIATQLDRDAVLAIAEREGWPAKYRKRGGLFGVIELWVEGCRLVEVLTPEMQAEYVGNRPPWTQRAFAA
jgi:hypothetical protein